MIFAPHVNPECQTYFYNFLHHPGEGFDPYPPLPPAKHFQAHILILGDIGVVDKANSKNQGETIYDLWN